MTKACPHGHLYNMEDRLGANSRGCPKCRKIRIKGRKDTRHRVRIRKWSDPKHRARITFNGALKRGKVTKRPCTVCGTTDNLEAHHEDYTKPLDVIWLCARHHRELHSRRAETAN